MPQGAKQVFVGKRYEIFQWDQLMFDGSYQTFERIKGPNTVGVIAITDNAKIIVLNEEQPYNGKFISLPGGVLESGEDPTEGIKRELLEETGYTSSHISLFKIFNNAGVLKTDYVFIAKHCHKITAQHLDPGEKIEINLMTYDEFINLIKTTETFRNILLAYCLLKIDLNPILKQEFLNLISN